MILHQNMLPDVMDAHHHPVRQTMVTGTNLEKQLPIFPCSDQNRSMGLYIDDTVLSLTTYFAWHCILSTHDQIPWMIKSLIFLLQQEEFITSHDALHCPAIPVFCTQQLPQHMRFTTNLVNTKQTQWSKLTSFVVGVLLATTLFALISVFPWNLCHRRSLENTTSYKHYLKNMWLNLIMIHKPGEIPWHSWISWQIRLLDCLPIGNSVTWHHIIGYNWYNWTWNMHAVSDAETNLLRKTSQGEEEEEEEEEEVNMFGLNCGSKEDANSI